MTEESRAIRHLKKNAAEGNISAMFQLFNSYYTGKNVAQNKSDAQIYLNKCGQFLESRNADETPENRITLDKLNLIDFRGFKEFTIEFDPNLTVLIGNNGVGKSSILEGISKILSWINSSIEQEAKSGKPFTYADINNSSNHYGEINTQFSFGKNSLFKGALSRAKQGASQKKGSTISELKSLADIWRVVNSKNDIALPIFAYYSVERSSSRSSKPKSSKLSIDSIGFARFDAITDALDAAGRVDHFLEWFIALDKKVNSHDSGILNELYQQINVLEELVCQDENHPLRSILNEKKQDYHRLQFQDPLNESIKIDQKYKKIVTDAITDIVPDITEIFVESNTGMDEVFFTVNESKVNIRQLSDGQRMFVALIADLARRMVMLNPNFQNPLKGQGIVLIDEIELHLHPQWQQQIIPKLQNKFPNIQFIITTHSPQVLSTVDKKCIRILDNCEGIAHSPEFQTRGVMSSEILEQIMSTKSIPSSVPEAGWLTDMLRFIEENKYLESEAKVLFQKLTNHFGVDHPEIKRLSSQINFQQLKAKIKEKKQVRK
jgi:predicted ATP-binding protein involved in virulence